MSEKPRRLGYLIDDLFYKGPQLYFQLSEEKLGELIFFSWTDASQTKWHYKKPYTNLGNFEFEVGDDVYDAGCPILGIYDLNNDEHLQKIINRCWNQQIVTEDIHLYE